MKQIEKHELFQHVTGFLKAKGIELTDGSYSQAIQKSCGFLTDAINLGQRGLSRAKVELDTKLDCMRQVIHEKTAPKTAATATPAAPAAAPAATATAAPPVITKPVATAKKPNSRKRKTRKAAARKR